MKETGNDMAVEASTDLVPAPAAALDADALRGILNLALQVGDTIAAVSKNEAVTKGVAFLRGLAAQEWFVPTLLAVVRLLGKGKPVTRQDVLAVIGDHLPG